MKINVLEPRVYNRISAGEVVERPASIVKELVENSIDAGAKNIRIEIEEGGIKNITVSDDGCGIERDDIVIAFLPHSTSKIKDVDDLDNIQSLGFRGEALASISSVCQVKLSTKTADSQIGYSTKVNGGNFDKVTEIARTNGTTISCSNLFFNTPARAKFLRKPKTEEAEITHLIEKFMLSNSHIAFSYYVDGKLIYNTTSCNMQYIIYTIYCKEVYDNIIELNYEDSGYRISGYITKPKISKSNRTYQTLFVNGRCVENFLISNAVQSVFESFLMKGRFPVYVISISLPADCVDVNVHPSKKEVKFENPNRMFSMVRKAVENALLSVNQIASFMFNEDEYIAAKNNNLDKVLNNNTQPLNDNDKTQLLNNNDRLADKNNQIKAMTRENVANKINLAQQGHSYSVDLFDRDKKAVDPKEFEIIVEKEENIKNKDIIDENNKTNSELDALSNMSIKDKYVTTTNNSSTFFFDQSGEKYTGQLRTAEQNFLKASVKDEMKILGTLFKTYMVIELDDSVYFIDQHAAHERLLFDRLVKLVDEGNVAKQELLASHTFTLGAKESQHLDMALDDLQKIGFNIEKTDYTYKITSVPYVLSYIELDKFVDELIKDSISWDKKPSDFIHNKLCQSACKHAIKAGDNLSKEECAYLIEQVRKGVMLCPHGRPITLVITKYEFEKMFKRVV